MYKKITLFLTCLLLSYACGWAAEHKLYGTVYEKESGARLSDVSIMTNTGEGTSTDQNGKYTLMLPDGEYTIEAEFIGYKVVYKKVTINGKDVKLDFRLETEFEELEEVVVARHKEDENVAKATIGVQRIDAEALKKMPSLMGETDVIKVIQMLPGVQSAAEGTSGFSVRGGKRTKISSSWTTRPCTTPPT